MDEYEYSAKSFSGNSHAKSVQAMRLDVVEGKNEEQER
jgi:hypothetical protein